MFQKNSEKFLDGATVYTTIVQNCNTKYLVFCPRKNNKKHIWEHMNSVAFSSKIYPIYLFPEPTQQGISY
jgi:hypothetical protein